MTSVIDTNKLKVISFDLDNTLYDNAPVILRAEKESQEYLTSEFKKQNKKYDVNDFIDTRNKLLNSKNITFDNLTHLRQECLRQVCFELQNADQITQHATDIFIRLRQQAIIPKPIEEMIKRLAMRFTLVSLTNGNCDANNLTVGKYFCKNYSPQQGHRAKPHVAMFQQLMSDFQISSEQLLHIGDELNSDGDGAINANCQFYLFQPFTKADSLAVTARSLLANLGC